MKWSVPVITAAATLASALHHEILDADEPENICKDTRFYLNRLTAGPFAIGRAGDACPPGYALARLDDPGTFNHAAIFLFSCLGPSQEAWVGRAMGTVWAEGDPLKLTAPDAIEKGGAPVSKSSAPGKATRQPSSRLVPSIPSSPRIPSAPAHRKRRTTFQAPRPTIYEKHHAPQQEIDTQPRIRTMGSVFSDSPEAVHPFLCQQQEDN